MYLVHIFKLEISIVQLSERLRIQLPLYQLKQMCKIIFKDVNWLIKQAI